MRMGLKRVTGWVAIYAVAFHTLLIGFDLAAAAARDSFDPFAITCLTSAHDTAPEVLATGLPGSEKTQVCKHCVLCGIAASSATTPQADFAFAPRLKQASRLLWADIGRPRADAPPNPHLPRGPPLFA